MLQWAQDLNIIGKNILMIINLILEIDVWEPINVDFATIFIRLPRQDGIIRTSSITISEIQNVRISLSKIDKLKNGVL
jgi:hypothetical protein